jgi:hypothetical protein
LCLKLAIHAPSKSFAINEAQKKCCEKINENKKIAGWLQCLGRYLKIIGKRVTGQRPVFNFPPRGLNLTPRGEVGPQE